MTRALLWVMSVVALFLSVQAPANADESPGPVPVQLTGSGIMIARTTVPSGPLVFNVTNKTRAARRFTVAGRSTPSILPGKSVVLRVTLAAGIVRYSSADQQHRNRFDGFLTVVTPCDSPSATTVSVQLAQDRGGLTVSRTSLPCGQINFVVTDTGSSIDSLHVFSKDGSTRGSTAELSPGQTANLILTFSTKGIVQLESGDYPPAEPEFGGDFGEEAQLNLN